MQMPSVNVGFVRIGAAKSVLYIGAYGNFFPNFHICFSACVKAGVRERSAPYDVGHL